MRSEISSRIEQQHQHHHHHHQPALSHPKLIMEFVLDSRRFSHPALKISSEQYTQSNRRKLSL